MDERCVGAPGVGVGVRATVALRGGPMVLARVETPVGEMVAGAVEEGVCLLEFGGRRAIEGVGDLERLLKRRVVEGDGVMLPSPLEQLKVELAAYFAGSLRVFSVPLVLPGREFERRVWSRLLAIPYGETRTYGQVAEEVSGAGASRAVGAANGRNRIAIVVPCHRVINSTGGLHGYGGGLERKRWLLEHEGARGVGGGLFGA